MAAYLVLLFAVLSRVLPHAFHTTSVGFTAVGGGLLFFGARRAPWQTAIAVLALAATDIYLTVYVYGFAFHASSYAVTWAWYAAVCLMGHHLLRSQPPALKVGGAVIASSTSFWLLSNFAVWAGSTMYAHTVAGLGACYVAALPFFANDAMSTAITAGALFGLPVLAASIVESLHAAQDTNFPTA